MEKVEITFLRKKYYFQSDEPENFRHLCSQVSGELDLLYEEYPSFSREQLLLLYILRNREGLVTERKESKEMFGQELDQEDVKDEQLGVDLDEIDSILNTDI
jgi:hypothetical protein